MCTVTTKAVYQDKTNILFSVKDYVPNCLMDIIWDQKHVIVDIFGHLLKNLSFSVFFSPFLLVACILFEGFNVFSSLQKFLKNKSRCVCKLS